MEFYKNWTQERLISRIEELERVVANLDDTKKSISENNPDNNSHHSYKQIDKILEPAAETIFIIDFDGICQYIIQYEPNIFIGDKQNFIGKKIQNITPSEVSLLIGDQFDQVKNSGVISHQNYTISSQNKKVYTRCTMYPYTESSILCKFYDITDQVKVSNQLKQSLKRVEQTEIFAYVGFWRYNTKSQIIEYSGFANRSNDDNEQFSVSLNTLKQYLNPTDYQRLDKILNANPILIERDGYEFHTNFKEKEISFFRINITQEYIECGDRFIEGYVQDITSIIEERNHLEMIKTAVDNTSEYVFATYPDGRLFFGNSYFKKRLKIKDDLSNYFIYDLVNEKNPGFWNSILENKKRETPAFKMEVSFQSEPDSKYTFDCSTLTFKNLKNQEIRWFFCKDISELLKYQEETKETYQLMHTVLDNIPVSVFMKDAQKDFEYIYINKAGKRFISDIGLERGLSFTDFDIFPKEEALNIRKDDIEALKTQRVVKNTYEFVDNNNKMQIVEKLRRIINKGNNKLYLLGISWDVTELAEITEELKISKEKAEESDRLKSAFLANMSHEIRTPLNAIVGFSRILCETNEELERKEYFNIIESNNNQLLKLINEILDMSKIESGIDRITNASTDLYRLCQKAHQTHELLCPPDIKLIFEEPAEKVLIECDKGRLFQVFSNLIGNAIKFTKSGEIRYGYHIAKNGENIDFFVKDTGIGIDKNHIDRIFDRFMKGDSFSPGTGLGLPICKSIIEKMNGQITVESEVGKGTSFIFSIPYILPEGITTKLSESRNQQIQKIQKEQPTVLLVEDTESYYLLLKAMLSEYKVYWAKDGKEAVELYAELKPDIIFMDLRLPVISGLDAIGIIRELSQDVPIIAVSSYIDGQERLSLFEKGCNEFLPKPIIKKKLTEILKKYI